MEKSKADKDSTGVCEKIYNAVAGNSPFQARNRKSGRSSQSSIVSVTTNVADSNQLTLQKGNKPGITLVSVPLKETVAQQKSAGAEGPHVNIQIHSEQPPMVQKNGEVIIRPSKTEFRDAAKPTTVFLHIEGSEDHKATLPKKQQEIVKNNTAASSGPDQLKKVASKNDQGIHVSPSPEPAKTAPSKPAVLKTMPEKNLIHQDRSDHRENQKPEQAPSARATDVYSNYIGRVKAKMGSPSDISGQNENTRPAARSATRKDSFNDRVAKYISRARTNFRTPSNVGDT